MSNVDSKQEYICQCCSYPFSLYSEMGTNADESFNTEYCIYCFKDGKWVDPNLTVEEVIEYTIPFIASSTLSKDEARIWLQDYIPRLKRWENDLQKLFQMK